MTVPRIETISYPDFAPRLPHAGGAMLCEATQAAGVGSTAVMAKVLEALIDSTGSMRGGWASVRSRLSDELALQPVLTPKQLDDILGAERLVRIAVASGVPILSIRPLLAEAIPHLIRSALVSELDVRAFLERTASERPSVPVARSRGLSRTAVLAACLAVIALAWFIKSLL